MFLLPLCVCVSVYVCVRDLLLFPNLAGPLSLPQVTLYSQSVGKSTHPDAYSTTWRMGPPCALPPTPLSVPTTYPGKCEPVGSAYASPAWPL